MTATAKGIPICGIASLVLLLGVIVFRQYNSDLHDRTGLPLIPWYHFNQICSVVMLAAAVCGVIAMRRGSKWWGLVVAPALWFAFVCFLNDL